MGRSQLPQLLPKPPTHSTGSAWFWWWARNSCHLLSDISVQSHAFKCPTPHQVSISPCHSQFLPMNSQIQHDLVFQLLLIPCASGKWFNPSTWVVSPRDVKYKHPQCNFWQCQSFWLQIYQQDLSLHLAAFPYPCSHKTLKCSCVILGYPQNNQPVIQALDFIFMRRDRSLHVAALPG